MNKELPISPPMPPAFHRTGRIAFKCKVSKMRIWGPFVVAAIFSMIVIGIGQPPFILGVFVALSAIIFFGVFLLLSKTILWNIEYSVENGILTITHPMRTLDIDISAIKKIRRGDYLIDRGGRNFTASYPNIHILYNKNQYVYISPQDERGLLKTLHSVNPNITFSKELNME